MATRRRRGRGGQAGKGTVNVSVEIDPPISELVERFDFLRKDLQDMRPAWDLLIPRLRREMGRHFMTSGQATGEAWKPWKASYGKRRPNGALLVLTGRLLNRITTRGVLSRTKRRLRFGIRHAGARPLQFGSPKQGISARPFLVVTPRIREHAQRSVDQWMTDVLKRWGINRKTGRMRMSAIGRRRAA